MPENDPCQQEPCKSKLQDYEAAVRQGRNFEAAIRFSCFVRNNLRDIIKQIFFMWLALFTALIICYALLLPAELCNPIAWALMLVSAFLLVYYIRLMRVTERLRLRMKDCTDQNFIILRTWHTAEAHCPAECLPTRVELSCNC